VFLKERIQPLNLKTKTIFLSHFLNKDFINYKDDFYFYNLPNVFQDSNSSSQILYLNYTNISSTLLNKMFIDKNKTVLPKYLPIYYELKIKAKFFFDGISLLKTKSHSKLENKIKYQAFVESFSSSSFFNYRLALMIELLLNNTNPNYIITTFEGHAWERLVYYFSKKATNYKIRTLGYQHAIFFKKQHAINRLLAKQFNPDVILCSGLDAKNNFLNSDFNQQSKVLVLGTKRLASVEEEKLTFPIKSCFLILMEGDNLECLKLIDLTLSLRLLLPEHLFILRFHPLTSISQIKSLRPILKNLPQNLSISSHSLEEDMINSGFAIYRGSSTIIKAVQYGLIPIYYNFKNEMTIDPFDLSTIFDRNISNSSEIFNILNMEEEEYFNMHSQLNNKLKNIFSPLDYTIIDKIKSL